MISKELLNSVYAYSGDRISDIELSGETIYYTLKQSTCFARQTINIHGLAHKCKEWACSHQYTVSSCIRDNALDNDTYEARIEGIDKVFYEETEPEAIFKACEWIWDNQNDEKAIDVAFDIESQVNKIYDDFDKELKKQKIWGMRKRDEAHKFNTELNSLKSRTCSNCVWNMYEEGGRDCNIYITAWSEQGYSHEEFSCNKWEPKDK